MDYRVLAKDLLKRKKQLVAAHETVEMEISDLKTIDSPAAGLISDAGLRLGMIDRQLNMIRQGMSVLDEYQRDVLDVFFVSNEKSAAEKLMEKYFKERSSVYRDRSTALDMFTRAIYGVVEM